MSTFKSSSWRKHAIELTPYSQAEMSFSDTKPNLFMVKNTSKKDAYSAIGFIPTSEKYEYVIKHNTDTVFGQPYGTNFLYFYNPTDITINLSVYTYAGDFDMVLLKNFEVNAEDIKFDGKITGFSSNVSLPSGSNKIGKVEVTNQFDGVLKTGNNKIGKVDIDNLPTSNWTAQKVADLETKIDAIITKLGSNSVKNKKTFAKSLYETSSEGWTEHTITPDNGYKITNILAIRNSTDFNILVSMYNLDGTSFLRDITHTDVDLHDKDEFYLDSKECVENIPGEFASVKIRIYKKTSASEEPAKAVYVFLEQMEI